MACKKDKCICKYWICNKKIYVHLAWCPESYVVKDYDALPWYKKLLTSNPRNWGKIYGL